EVLGVVGDRVQQGRDEQQHGQQDHERRDGAARRNRHGVAEQADQDEVGDRSCQGAHADLGELLPQRLGPLSQDELDGGDGDGHGGGRRGQRGPQQGGGLAGQQHHAAGNAGQTGVDLPSGVLGGDRENTQQDEADLRVPHGLQGGV